MYIGFNLDDVFYSGTATFVEKEGKSGYLVDLNESVRDNAQFTIEKDSDGNWMSEDAGSPDLVKAAGTEIDAYDESYTGEPLSPNNYYSGERTNGLPPIFKNGEVTNEPDDVSERSPGI